MSNKSLKRLCHEAKEAADNARCAVETILKAIGSDNTLAVAILESSAERLYGLAAEITEIHQDGFYSEDGLGVRAAGLAGVPRRAIPDHQQRAVGRPTARSIT